NELEGAVHAEDAAAIGVAGIAGIGVAALGRVIADGGVGDGEDAIGCIDAAALAVAAVCTLETGSALGYVVLEGAIRERHGAVEDVDAAPLAVAGSAYLEAGSACNRVGDRRVGDRQN